MQEWVLEMKQISKVYGSVTANRDIDFKLQKGEIHALIGENGAGKTTLMRILYGMESPTSGSILVKGKEVHFRNPTDAIHKGIGMVHQHFMLFPSLTVMENIVAGKEPHHAAGWFDRKTAYAKVKQLCDTYKLPVPLDQKVSDCSLGLQQRIEILKVLYHGADILVLDEPTAVLTPLEVKEFLVTLKQLSDQGKSIILISHKLHEVMEVADQITVLRQGKVTGSLKKQETNEEELSRLMVGRELGGISKKEVEKGPVVLELDQVFIRGDKGKPLLNEVSLRVQGGEIVGIAGVSGNGQSELLQAISGLVPVDRGKITLMGKDVTNAPVRNIREAGLAHIPEDRYQWGAAKEATVQENAIMGHYHRAEYSSRGLLKTSSLFQRVEQWVKQFTVKTSSLQEKSQNLSGGNLQKLIVAREVEQHTPFLLAAEPTRGVDIGAMELIHQQLMEKRNRGEAVLLVSSELSEVMSLSDRILVMYEGEIIGEAHGDQATEEQISLWMAGGMRK